MSSTELDWFKSSYSGSSGDNCIEVANCREAVRVRDSKDKEGGQLALSRTTWSTFVAYAADARA
ncbi:MULTISPECIES: DUF397 domain-containing protein [unclassified Streptomyces]|uniref:DUF397 domain-containing protein n=1 Tax=unclassified Streptomyces TaxID=2593676 RepID=UPI001162F8EA|nr:MULTISPECIES: DUF397 domain-containing protein [unclassified Streptomyces]QDN93510.1 DUF397 domain-containing protein [Streptomyces sp. RLB3-6]QDO05102.1 DUF397 domain-containing protein [Streptomyces sp. S1D4-23]